MKFIVRLAGMVSMFSHAFVVVNPMNSLPKGDKEISIFTDFPK
jgi:hypothetical protein